MIEIEYDAESDALYVRLTSNPVERTIDIDGFQVVDLDASGEAVGVEVLTPARHFDIARIALRYGFFAELGEIAQNVADVVPEVSPTVAPYSFASAMYLHSIVGATSVGPSVESHSAALSRGHEFSLAA
jgi:uncharacterized protein YuzE